ncbi:MAG: radical SAM protein [Bacteroidia bacterium]|nr:radical SAM protein [Bacteroidia bacterium]
MAHTVLLITPPFTQLNTPYPATAYLKGFLNTKNIACFQADLGIEVILRLFSREGLTRLFEESERAQSGFSDNAARIFSLKEIYIQSIDSVIHFLQGKNPSYAHLIVQEDYLPEAGRFQQKTDMEWAFGTLGIMDKAKHLATLYLEDLSDFIQETTDKHFGFSRYAEKLGRSANSFDELYEVLQGDFSFTDKILLEILKEKMSQVQPDLVGFSVPFPGNLYSAFRCTQWIKAHYPEVITVMGGGFPNTELRSVSDSRVFQFFDFITLDDGEAPFEHLIEYIQGKRKQEELKRTFGLKEGVVTYFNNSTSQDYKQSETGTPDYSDLLLDQYISVLEVANPMHRLWSDGRWNKLTMAHGCYWGKCTFCDISLDYIKVYEPVAAKLLCDRMETLIQQTGNTGFHFVDEAAPPALMRELALEILRRKLVVSWWTNIRFEKNFSQDLCLLLKASGCIAVSGGLEVASDRLLALIEKGVTVSQVAQVTRNFTEAGIMVHAYLMYGFPTQTDQETIDSLEMVRQMFEEGVLQSGFWHQFALTAHSPAGMYPEKFSILPEKTGTTGFAINDLVYTDPKGGNHEKFSFGLKKSLFNYMHGIGMDFPLQQWFDFKVPKTTVPKNYIENCLNEFPFIEMKPSSKIVWLGEKPRIKTVIQQKKGKEVRLSEFTFHKKKGFFTVSLPVEYADWLSEMLTLASVCQPKTLQYGTLKAHFEASGLSGFELFWYGKPIQELKESGLLLIL